MHEQEQKNEREQSPKLNPRVWIGSWADYNNGRLHGDWCDAAAEPEELWKDIHHILATSHEEIAEDWGVFDYDEFGGFTVGEAETVETITTVARGIAQHGEAFSLWAELHDADPEMLANFEDAYLGEYDSAEDWARELMDDTGVEQTLNEAIPEGLRPYVQIDYEQFARDARGSDIHFEESSGGGVYVFRMM